MSDFPAIRPSAGRSYGFGQYQGEIVTYPNGDASRYKTGARITMKPLTLPYELITTAEMIRLRDHYLSHGKWRAFRLPAMIWCYVIGANHPVMPANGVFLWSEPFSATARGADWWEASASLRSAIPMTG